MVALFWVVVSTVDEFIDGNQTELRQIARIVYAVLLILVLYYNVYKGKLKP